MCIRDRVRTQRRDCAGEERARQKAEKDEEAAARRLHPVDQHIDPDMDPGSDTIGGTKFGHPDEKDDRQFLSPNQVDRTKAELERFGRVRKRGHPMRFEIRCV